MLDGEDMCRCCDDDLAHIRNRKIGFVFQSFNLIPDLDVRDNVDVPLRYRGMPARPRKEAIEQALEVVGLTSRIKHYPAQLSGGQQQRVAVARALVGQPKLILADEPTGNLDTENGAAVMEMLGEINRAGTTVVMVTHSLAHAALAQRTIRLLDGQVVSETLLAA